MADIIKLRRDTAANWASANPVLSEGEIGVVIETNQPTRIKVGNGSTSWNSLPYASERAIADILVDDTSLSTIKGENIEEIVESVDNSLLETKNTGIKFGGRAVVDGGIGVGNTISVTSGEGIIVNNTNPAASTYLKIAWTSKSVLELNTETPNITYWYVDDNSDTIKQTTTIPTESNRKTRIYLFKTIVVNSIIVNLIPEVTVLHQTSQSIKELSSAIGGIKLRGLKPVFNGGNLNFNITEGDIYTYSNNYSVSYTNTNKKTLPLFNSSNTSFRYATTTATVNNDVNVLSPGNYQVEGVVTAIPGDDARIGIHLIWVFPNTSFYRVSYGLNYYETNTEALEDLASLNPLDTVPSEFSDAILLGAILVNKSSTNLETDATFIATNKFGLFDNLGKGGEPINFTNGLTEVDGNVSWYTELMPGINQVVVEDDTALIIGSVMGQFGLTIASEAGESTTTLSGDTIMLNSSDHVDINANSIDIYTGNGSFLLNELGYSISVGTGKYIDIEGADRLTLGTDTELIIRTPKVTFDTAIAGQVLTLQEDGSTEFEDKESNANIFIPKLSADIVSGDTNKIYSIRDIIDLEGASITIPTGTVLTNNGGEIINGTITLDATSEIDPSLLGSDLIVLGDGKLTTPSYTLNLNKYNIVEGVVTDAVALTNTQNLNKAIEDVYNLKGKEIFVDTLDAFFYVWTDDFNAEYSTQYSIRMQEGVNFTGRSVNSTILRVQPDNSFASKLIHTNKASNIKISGMRLVGDRADHDYSPVNDRHGNNRDTHEYGGLLNIVGSHNLVVDGVIMEECTGDLMAVLGTAIRHNGTSGGENGTVRDGHSDSQNIIVQNCHFYRGRRNNISVVDGINVTFLNCIIDGAGNGYTITPGTVDAGGVLPRFGIDVEPYRERDAGGVELLYEITENISIIGCKFQNNYSGDITCFKGERVLVQNCVLDNIINVVFGKENRFVGNTLRKNPNIATAKTGISVNNAIVNNEGVVEEVVLGNTIEDNSIFDFDSGIAIRGKNVICNNNKVYNFVSSGLSLNSLQKSRINTNYFETESATAAGINATSTLLSDVIVDNNTFIVPNNKGVDLESVNTTAQTNIFTISNNRIEAAIALETTANVYGLIFDGNYVDNTLVTQNLRNSKIINNTTPEAGIDVFLDHFFDLEDVVISGNIVHGTSISKAVMFFSATFTAGAFDIQRVKIENNKIIKTGNARCIHFDGDPANFTNISIINNVFEKDGTQEDIQLGGSGNIILNNYCINALTNLDITGTNTFSNATPPQIGTGTELYLNNSNGTYYNSIDTPSSATTYTFKVGSLAIGGKVSVYIDAASQPAITGGTYRSGYGDAFIVDTFMIMKVENISGTVYYWFEVI